MITVINLSSKIEDMKKDIENYTEVAEAINLQECTDYRFYSNSEILIYNERTIMYSCSWNEYKNKKYITDIYNRDAQLIYQYRIDYSK